MHHPKGHATCRTDMGDELTALGKLRHREVLYGRQEDICKGCRRRPKRSKGHRGISPIEP